MAEVAWRRCARAPRTPRHTIATTGFSCSSTATASLIVNVVHDPHVPRPTIAQSTCVRELVDVLAVVGAGLADLRAGLDRDGARRRRGAGTRPRRSRSAATNASGRRCGCPTCRPASGRSRRKVGARTSPAGVAVGRRTRIVSVAHDPDPRLICARIQSRSQGSDVGSGRVRVERSGRSGTARRRTARRSSGASTPRAGRAASPAPPRSPGCPASVSTPVRPGLDESEPARA